MALKEFYSLKLKSLLSILDCLCPPAIKTSNSKRKQITTMVLDILNEWTKKFWRFIDIFAGNVCLYGLFLIFL